MENFNRVARNILAKGMRRYMNMGYTIQDSAKVYANWLYTLEDSTDIYQKVFRKYLISVMYLDAYKLTSYKQKECTEYDINFSGQLFDIEDIDDLLTEVSADPTFLEKIIESCYEFEETNGLGKVYITKSLSALENEFLIEEFPIHQQDLNTYHKEMTLDYLIKNMRGQASYQEKIDIDFKEAIAVSIAGFVRNLLKVDRDNALKLLLEIAKVDYAGSKYLVDRIENNDYLIDHIDCYENYDIDYILCNLSENQDFLTDALFMISDVYVYQQYSHLGLNEETIKNDDYKELEKKLILV